MEKNKLNKIKLSYWGSIDPKDYGIKYDFIPSPFFQPWQNNYTHIVPESTIIEEDCSAKEGLIAISVTNLYSVYLQNKTCYEWLNQYEPIEKIGKTIFIYDI